METVIVGAWSIWKERNNMLFNGIDPLVHIAKKDLHPYINNLVASL
jgi:hypothetical protein